MSETTWVDHYETLQLSSSADADTVERVYRLLAKRYHPDNDRSGDVERFNQVREAYETLSDPDRRASYDATYDNDRSQLWQLFSQDPAESDRDDDQRIFHGILSLLYIARRRDPVGGGMAPMHMERLLGVDREHLTFPLWYLKQRGYIEVLENGLTAISVEGIDKLGTKELSLPAHRLLTEQAVGDTENRQHELPRYSSAS